MTWTLEKAERFAREVRDDLASGRISERQFNMDSVMRESHCGTVGCIGGWMLYKEQAERGFVTDTYLWGSLDGMVSEAGRSNLKRAMSLHKLFYSFPPNAGPKEAVAAIDRWLDGSTDPWTA